MDGFNVTLFAYGQTGAGKTHTIYGSKKARRPHPATARAQRCNGFNLKAREKTF